MYKDYGKIKSAVQRLLGAKRFSDARAKCENMCRKFPDNPEPWFMLGAIYGQLEEFGKAVDCCRKVVTLAPEEFLAHYNMGIALYRIGNLEDAGKSLSKAIELNPSSPDAHRELGNVLYAREDFTGAVSVYTKARQLAPASVDVLCNLGKALERLGRLDESLDIYHGVVRLAPNEAASYYNLGNALWRTGALGEAEKNFQKSLSINSDLVQAMNNLGLVLQESGKKEDAQSCFEQAIRNCPEYCEPYINLSAMYREKRALVEAKELLETALATNPQSPNLHADMSLLLVQSGDFSRGWDEYEWRRQVSGISPRPSTLPEWNGESLEGRTILVYAEQGIGDEIMFSSCLPDLIAKAGHVVVDCDERLAPLFSRSFPTASFHGGPQNSSTDWLSDYPDISTQMLLGSLPSHFRRTERAFPRHTGYLVADPVAVREWENRFTKLGKGLKVGISWRGGHVSQREKRSVALAQWAPLLETPYVDFINLQYGDCKDEVREFTARTGITIYDWEDSDALADLDNFAAQISALDLVISVDNSTVHMAAALARPVWVLLPYASDWRWLLNRNDSPWYPTVRLFRQQQPGHWGAVLEEIVPKLHSFSQS